METKNQKILRYWLIFLLCSICAIIIGAIINSPITVVISSFLAALSPVAATMLWE